eukprot:12260713-Karenia_brevis.AAC.1
MWWHCPAWDDIRTKHANVWFALRDSWPACFRLCGIMPSTCPECNNLDTDADGTALLGPGGNIEAAEMREANLAISGRH